MYEIEKVLSFFLNCRRLELVCGTLQYEGHDGPRTKETSINGDAENC